MSNLDSADWLEIFDRFSEYSRQIQSELNGRIAGIPEFVENRTLLDVHVSRMRRLLSEIDELGAVSTVRVEP